MEIYRIYTFDTRQRIYLYGNANANASVLNVLLGVFPTHLPLYSCHTSPERDNQPFLQLYVK